MKNIPGPDLTEYCIPIDTKKTAKNLKEVEDKLRERIKGQNEAIKHIIRKLAIQKTKIKDPKRPIGAMIFLGPPGTGKTYTAKELGRILIGEEEDASVNPVTLIECANLAMEHSIHSLIGAPPSYVGFGQAAILKQEKIDKPHSEQILKTKYKDDLARARKIIYKSVSRTLENRRMDAIKATEQLMENLKSHIIQHEKPISVIVFDEIEKAHPNIINLLLDILEEGELTLSDGSVTNFSNSFFIFTSNIGSRDIRKLSDQNPIGFIKPQKQDINGSKTLNKRIYSITKEAFEKWFPPEFVSRLRTEIIAFRVLEFKDYLDILNLFLNDLQKKFDGSSPQKPPLLLRYTKPFKKFLVNEGTDSQYGARVLRSVVERHVLFELSQTIVSKELKPGDEVLFLMKDGKPKLYRKKRPTVKSPFEFEIEERRFDVEKVLKQWGFIPSKTFQPSTKPVTPTSLEPNIPGSNGAGPESSD